MNHTFIIGYMFAGKTTYGRQLAGELNIPFSDLDSLIEQRCGKTITEIFHHDGESFFRQQEHTILEELSQKAAPSVISCGGGTPCHHDNITLMKNSGKVIYLRTPLETLFSRALKERENRPLLSNISDSDLKDFIAKQLQEREFFYLQADLIYDSQPINPIQK